MHMVGRPGMDHGVGSLHPCWKTSRATDLQEVLLWLVPLLVLR